jgi:tetratricopeptide (TPR) repeat protein
MTDRDQFRRRVLASAALWLLVAALLSALSFFVVALVLTAVLALGVLAAAGIWALYHYGGTAVSWTGQHVGEVRERAPALDVQQRGKQLSRQGQRLGRRAKRAAAATKRATATTPERSRTLGERAVRFYAATVYGATTLLGRLVERTGRKRAIRLNARGTQLRREGHAEQAAEQHRVALAILRDLGDPQAEAMTLNNLALALAQDGAGDQAVEHLEEALTVLRTLGDEEHEGQVIANLGFVHRRQGHSEEAENLLHEALDKLPPESPAYRQVEKQLLRAS